MRFLFALWLTSVATQTSTWTDSETQLTWTTTDNRSGLSWQQAMHYCRDLRTNGYSNWRLPAIDELQQIYKPGDEGNSQFHLRGPLQLSGWQWSSTSGQQHGESWVFDFSDGGRASVANGDSGLNRALCVRPAR